MRSNEPDLIEKHKVNSKNIALSLNKYYYVLEIANGYNIHGMNNNISTKHALTLSTLVDNKSLKILFTSEN